MQAELTGASSTAWPGWRFVAYAVYGSDNATIAIKQRGSISSPQPQSGKRIGHSGPPTSSKNAVYSRAMERPTPDEVTPQHDHVGITTEDWAVSALSPRRPSPPPGRAAGWPQDR